MLVDVVIMGFVQVGVASERHFGKSGDDLSQAAASQ